MWRAASSKPRLIGSMVARSSNSSVMSRNRSDRREIDTVQMTGLSTVSWGRVGRRMFQCFSVFNVSIVTVETIYAEAIQWRIVLIDSK